MSAIGHEPDTPLLDYVADLRASTPTDAAKRVVPAVADELHHLTQLRRRAWYAVDQRLGREQHQLDAIRSRPSIARPSTLIDEQSTRVDDLVRRARRSLGHRLDLAHHEAAAQLARVRALSPLRTLERGYAVAQAADGSVLTSITQLSADDEVSLRVVDGHVRLRTLSTAPAAHADLDEES